MTQISGSRCRQHREVKQRCTGASSSPTCSGHSRRQDWKEPAVSTEGPLFSAGSKHGLTTPDHIDLWCEDISGHPEGHWPSIPVVRSPTTIPSSPRNTSSHHYLNSNRGMGVEMWRQELAREPPRGDYRPGCRPVHRQCLLRWLQGLLSRHYASAEVLWNSHWLKPYLISQVLSHTPDTC